MKRFLLYVMLLVPGLSFGQFSDKMLYRAYLEQDMFVWNQYLTYYKWEALPSLYEHERYLNYEYGYLATAVEDKTPDVKERVEAYARHIDQMEDFMDDALVLTYRSAYYAYRAKLYPKEFVSSGMKAWKIAQEAVKADSLNPLALTLMGCVDFYAPAIFGGSKKRALETFTKAEAIMMQQGDTMDRWNFPALELQRAMCLDKTGNTKEAIALCRRMLSRDTGFVFVRDEYLPQLLDKH